MMFTAGSIPDDLAACQTLIEAQQAVIESQQQQLDQLKGTTGQQSETIEALQQTIDKLRHELEPFKRYVFGQRRERYVEDSRQQKLFEIGPQ